MAQFILVLSNIQVFSAVLLGLLLIGAIAIKKVQHKDEDAPKPLQSRGFVSRFLVCGVLIGLSIALLNYLINPLGLYATPGLGPITTMSRYAKVVLWNRLSAVPSIVILGSSRGATAPASYITKKYGTTAFNASFFGAKVSDYYAFAAYLYQHHQLPKVFIVGLGPEQLVTDSFPSEPMAQLSSRPRRE